MAAENEITVRALINRSLKMFGALRDGADTASGTQIQDALEVLNELLARHSTFGLIIPYLTEIKFKMSVGKGNYVIGKKEPVDIVSQQIRRLDYVQFIWDKIYYSVNILGFNSYYGQTRVEPLATLPFNVLLQNDNYNSTLIFYPEPDREYDCIVRAKQELREAKLDDRLDEVPIEMHSFLRYALARELVDFYGGLEWTPKQEAIYQDTLRAARGAADLDLTLNSTPKIQPYGSTALLGGWGY